MNYGVVGYLIFKLEYIISNLFFLFDNVVIIFEGVFFIVGYFYLGYLGVFGNICRICYCLEVFVKVSDVEKEMCVKI